jgi:hypothetical protein
MTALAKTEAERQARQMFYGPNAFARPFILPPESPPSGSRSCAKTCEEIMCDPSS